MPEYTSSRSKVRVLAILLLVLILVLAGCTLLNKNIKAHGPGIATDLWSDEDGYWLLIGGDGPS